MKAQEAQRYARIAGLLLLVSLVAGGFGESYVPGKLMAGADIAETARRVGASVGLFRAGFAAYLVEATCDLALTGIFYVLLRPVSRPLSVIAACFGVFSTATFAVGEIFYFAAGLPGIDADVARALTPDARVSFIYLCLTLYGYIFAIFAGFYGIAVMLRGYLIFRSGYLPRALGGIVVLAGACFVVKNMLAVLAPRYDSMVLVIPMLVAMAGMMVWLLVKGIDRDGWERVATSSNEGQGLA
jgi:hypothetical protein